MKPTKIYVILEIYSSGYSRIVGCGFKTREEAEKFSKNFPSVQSTVEEVEVYL